MVPKTHPLLLYMRKHDYSYRRAGEELGCHYTTLHQIVIGRHEPSPDMARRIVAWSGGKLTMDKLYQVK